MSMDTGRPKHPRLRITLRLSMALVLVLGLWMGWQVNKAREQREAVAAVKRYGGWVRYNWELAKATGPNAPSWLRRYLGDEYFQQIAYVNLVYDDSTGTRYDIDNTKPADDVLARLDSMSGVREILLTKTQVTDRGMKHLGQLRNLEKLFIWDASEVSDQGVAHLASLKNLNMIHISNSRMTDAGLAELAKLPTLEVMSLQGNQFTDEGLASLRGCTKLRRLCVGLGNTRITDDGLVYLKNLKNLQLLDLQRTSVTDAGLEKLKGLTKLKEIWLSQTKTTQTGKEAFKAAVPRLRVIR